MNYVLIITLVLLMVCFIIGWAKGLFGILSGILSWVIILAVMYFATPVIEQAYTNGPVYEKMYNMVSDHVSNGLVTKENEAIDKLNEQIAEENAAAENGLDTGTEDETQTDDNSDKVQIDLTDSQSMRDFLESISISLPSKVTSIIARVADDATNAAAGIVENITADKENQISSANTTIVDSVSKPLASLMVRGIALLTALLIAIIITRIIALIAHALGDAPVVGGISRFLGGIWGLIVAMILVFLFMDLVTCFAITPNGAKLMSQIESSDFLNSLYINNPLGFLISK